MEKFKEGDIVALFGKIEFYQGFRIIHPEFDILDQKDDPINTSRIVPLYSSNNILKKAGLKMVYVGIESSNTDVLKDINRFTVKNDQQYEIIKKLK